MNYLALTAATTEHADACRDRNRELALPAVPSHSSRTRQALLRARNSWDSSLSAAGHATTGRWREISELCRRALATDDLLATRLEGPGAGR